MFGRWSRVIAAPITIGTLGLGAAAFAAPVAECSSEDHIPSLDYGWTHHGAFSAYDKKAIRRGFQVYRQVMQYM